MATRDVLTLGSSDEDPGSCLRFRKEIDPVGLAIFLEDSGLPSAVSAVFEENDIDGEIFLELTESEIKNLVPKLGMAKKVLKLRAKVDYGLPDSQAPVPATPSGASVPISRESTSPLFPSPTGSICESEDVSSLASSAAAMTRKFVIPTTWRPSIMDCIQKDTEQEQRQTLIPTIRNEIVRDLVAQMFSYNSNPQKEFCANVAQMLVRKYEFMADKGHKVSGYGSWEKKIIERVHNVKATRKRSVQGDDVSTPSAKRGRPKQKSLTLTRYPPLKDTADDSITISRNLESLRKELKKNSPNKENVLSMCRQTFCKRREDILDGYDGVTATNLLEKYGELHRSYVIEQEINLIVEKTDLFSKAVLDWNTKWVPAILEYSYTLAGKKATMVLSLQKNYEGDPEYRPKTAVAILCHLLPKKGNSKGNSEVLKFIYEKCKITDDPDTVAKRDVQKMAPRFASFEGEDSCQYFIFVEKVILTQANSFSKALLLWFVSHYVLNLEYGSNIKEVALFFQEFVCNLPATGGEKRQKNATYLSVTTDIQKYAR